MPWEGLGALARPEDLAPRDDTAVRVGLVPRAGREAVLGRLIPAPPLLRGYLKCRPVIVRLAGTLSVGVSRRVFWFR